MLADVASVIIKFIPDGRTYKSFIFVCKMFAKCASDEMADKFCNHIATIALLSPDKFSIAYKVGHFPLDKLPDEWPDHMYYVSMNQHLTDEFVMAYPHYKWRLSEMRGVNLQKIISALSWKPEKAQVNYLLGNGWVSLEYYHEIYKDDNDWRYVSDIVPLEFIEEHLNYLWDWERVSRRRDITRSFVTKYIHHMSMPCLANYFPLHEMFDWKADGTLRKLVSKYKKHTIGFIRENEKYLNWKKLTDACNVDMIMDNFDLPWTEQVMYRSIRATDIGRVLDRFGPVKACKLLLSHLIEIEHIIDKYYDMFVADGTLVGHLCSNVNLTKEIIAKYPLLRWNGWWDSGVLLQQQIARMCDVSKNVSVWEFSNTVTIDFIEKNPEIVKLLVISAFTNNKNIPIKYFIDNPVPVSYSSIVCRKDFTWRLYLKYPNFGWDFAGY